MSGRLVVLGRSIALAMPLLLWAAPSRADIPAGYKGTPYMGTPWPIPGRIEFENYDDGGQDVAWHVDDHTGNFGQGGCAGNDIRMGIHPQICRTNTSTGENDLYSAGPQKGTHYPSDAMPQSYYIGYTHPSDWVKLTVNVATAGTYKISSTWASDPAGAGGIKMQILFNDKVKADVSLTGTGGYHNWVEFPDFATVQLDAGVQVLQFAPKSFHLNYDYLQISLVKADGTVDPGGGGTAMDGGPSAGAGGMSGAGGMAGTGGSPGGSGGESTTGAGGATGAGGSPTTGAGGEPAMVGTGTAGESSTTGGGTDASGVAPRNADAGGCACTMRERSHTGNAAVVMLTAGMVALARRRRR
jgi:MYXO-CTERM domain-containing protein